MGRTQVNLRAALVHKGLEIPRDCCLSRSIANVRLFADQLENVCILPEGPATIYARAQY